MFCVSHEKEQHMKRVRWGLIAILLAVLPAGDLGAQGAAQKSAGAGPVLIVETAKGAFQIETYPGEAPKTVEHILALVKRNFYNGHRIHRVVPGFVVQFGDPQSRDMTKRDRWGSGGSGRSIGVGEFSPNRKHVVGAVAAAHPGDARLGDSQMYITLAAQPKLDGQFTVFGQVISGMDVVRKLAVNDIVRRVTVKP
jgi:peptidyl-prolyl cis-trans isomerase B (cyclophilin B)